MLNPKHKRYANRLEELIQEGENVVKLESTDSRGISYIKGKDKIILNAWLVNVSNIIETVFGDSSPQFRHFKELTKKGIGKISTSREIYPIIGVLSGALDDLKQGYLLGQEFIIASEVFDSLLEQAKHLVQTGYKDPAAVLARVVLEDTLKRLARAESIDDTLKASRINDELKKLGKYPQPQWRFVQGWLDIGNAAAHGKFNDYTDQDVKQLITDIEHFLAAEFRV